MTLADCLTAASEQMLRDGKPEVELLGRSWTVGKTRSMGLRTVAFVYDGIPVEGIEQNPEKSSRWAQLAREGKLIVQFRAKGRFFANVCDGKLTRYPVWTSLGLPE